MKKVNPSIAHFNFKKFQIRNFILLAMLFLLVRTASYSQLVNIPVTGFNNDVVASGVGPGTALSMPGVSNPTIGVDGAGYTFIDNTYKWQAANAFPTCNMPVSGLAASAQTPGLTYTFQNYVGNNALTIDNNSTTYVSANSLVFSNTGTLTLPIPASYAKLYVLFESVVNVSPLTVNVVVTFTDATTQTFTSANGNLPNWFDATLIAFTNVARAQNVSPGLGTTCPVAPNFFEMPLTLIPANYGKLVQSINFTIPTVLSSGVNPFNVNYFHAMAVGGIAPCTIPAQPGSLSFVSAGTSQITQSFTEPAVLPSGYLVVTYPAGNSPTLPATGTTYTSGQTIGGTGKVSFLTPTAASAPKIFSVTGLNPATAYDFYVYSYNGPCVADGSNLSPTYNTGTTVSLLNQFTLACGSLSGVVPIGPGLPNTPGGGWTSLTNAMAYINVNGLGGNLVLELQAGYDGTAPNETFPIAFPVNPCINNTKTLTIRPASGVNGLVITGTNAGPIFDFNGATYVTIDGTPGGTIGTPAITFTAAGSNHLTLLNIRNTNAAGSAIKFGSQANNNAVKYCDLQGQNTINASVPATIAGVVYFENSGATGNDFNTIDHCNIHSSSNVAFPTLGVYSIGPNVNTGYTVASNDNNTVSNCNIYDFSSTTTNAVGLELNFANNAWTITNNSFFQTASRSVASTFFNRPIWLIPFRGTTGQVGNGFNVSGNFIGGSQPLCAGTPYTMTTTGIFDGIRIEVADVTPAVASSVQGNTIKNISLTTTSTAADPFHGILVVAGSGKVDIGTVSGNIIGGTSGAGMIFIASGSTASFQSMGIGVFNGTAASTYNINNNKIGGIILGTTATSNSFTGIYTGASVAASIVNIDNNTVGRSAFTDSINILYTSTVQTWNRGILIAGGTPVVAITNNTVTNLNNSTTSTTAGSQTAGIIVVPSTALSAVTNNVVRDLSCAANATSGSATATLNGIAIAAPTVACNVSGNTVDSLVNTNVSTATASLIYGMFCNFSASAGISTYSNNFVENIYYNAANTSAIIRGLETDGGTVNIFNNVVRLGLKPDGSSITTPMSITGIFRFISANSGNTYFNSVYIGGTGVTAGAANSVAFCRNTIPSTGVDTIRNNVFVNARSGAGTGRNYAIHLNQNSAVLATVANTFLNNNVYRATGTNGFFAGNGTTTSNDVATYTPGWFTGTDLNSWNLDPQFIAPAAGTANLHISTSLTTPVEGTGTAISYITTDKDGNSRAGLTPTDLGAYAGNYISMPACTAPNTPTGVITLTPISISQIDGSFNASVPAADAYMVVRYFSGATPTTPVNGTIYSVGTLLGAGTVISIGATTTFSATGLFGGTAYDFYVYPYNTICVGVSPFYNTVFPFATASTLSCSAISGTFPVGPTAPVSPAGFPFLKNALAYLTANGMGGNVILELQSDYSSVTDTVVIGNIPCLGPLQQLTIRPAAGATGLSITTAHSIASVDINGGSFVTIDGRPGGTGVYVAGTSLLIKNTNATAPAIRLINDARYNTIQYCDLQSNNSGATGTATGGVVLISNTTGPNGNDYNTIDHCDIHNISGGNPIMAVNGLGTTTTALQYNEFNIISNCNIYDCFNATVGTAGIYAGAGTGNWTITDNHFYQTALRIPTGTATYRDIYINNATGNTNGSGFVITNNYIGGSDNAGNGLYNMIGASAYLYNSMTIGVGIGTPTSIQNNTIKNLSISSISTSAATMSCINVTAGVVNIGTVTGNMIGAANTDASISPAITYTSTSTTNGGIIPIFAVAPLTCNISNNTIAGIQIVGNATAAAAEFNGIGYNNGTVTISNNTIGSLTTAKSIYCATSSTTATSASRFLGILISVTGATNGITITGNKIANMYTNFAATTAPTTSGAKGIFFTGAFTNSTNITISNNLIRDITTFAQTTSSGAAGALQGISLATTGAFGSYNVSGNTIYNLNQAGASTSNAVQAAGIYINCTPSGTSSISKNFIHSIGISANNPFAVVNGIEAAAGSFTYSNNMIRLGINGAGASVTSPSVFRGIVKSTTTNNNFYFNTVYIGGTGVGASSSTTYGFLRTGSPSATNDNINNNIFVNNRSNAVGGGASHFAIGITSGTTFLTSNNNDFYASGTDGALGLVGATTFCPTLPLWQLYSTKDASSYNDDPLFFNATGDSINVNLHINSGITATNLESQGIAVGGITTDFDNNVRPGPAGSVNGGATAPDIGADEFDGVPRIPPAAPGNPTQAGGTPTCSGGSVLTATGTAPSGVIWYWQTSATGTDQINNASAPLTVFANGTYYIRAYSTSTTLWSLTSGSVTVSNFPAGPATPPAPVALNNPACATGTTISVTAAPAGQVYYWQSSTNGTSIAQNANVPLPVTVAGTYYVRSIDTTSGCWSNTNSVNVTFLAPLTGSYTATQIVSCGGTGAINISANGSATVISNSFSSPALNPLQATLAGVNAAITTLNVPALGLANQGVLQFTQAANSQSGGILINNLTGLSSNDFQIDFDMITTTSGGSPADGFSYSYGDDVVALPTNTAGVGTSGVNTLAPECGSGTKLKFAFDAINNTGGCSGGLPASVANGNVTGTYLMYNCTAAFQGGAPNLCNGVLNFDGSAAGLMWKATPASGSITHVTLKMSGAGTATLQMTGIAGVATGQSFGPTSYTLPASYLTENKATWKHAFCARTGGLNEGHYIDNLSIQYANIYEYSIDNGANWSFNQNFTGLATGNYIVLVRYAALPNCITNLGSTFIAPPPSTFTTVSTANPVCSGVAFTTSLTPSALAGSTYKWESSPDGTTWTPIPSATGATYIEAAGITTPNYYHCIVICGTDTVTSTTLQVTLNSFLNCYCTSTATAIADEDIVNVTYGTLNNTSTCASTGGGSSVLNLYSDYSLIAAPNILQANPVSFSIQVGSCGSTTTSNRTAIFIDFNHDALFTGPGENVYLSPSSTVGPHSETGSITIPISALTGNTRMRVITVQTTGAISPCGTYTSGETEDYTINITPAPPCSGNPVAGTIPATLIVCGGNTASLSSTGYTTSASGITFQWLESNDNGVADPWAAVTTGTNGFSTIYNTNYVSAALTSSIYYRLLATCTNGGGKDTSNASFVEVVNPTVLTVANGIRCGAGTVTIGATPSVGSTLSWYTVPTGGTALLSSVQTVDVTGFSNDVVANGLGVANTASTGTLPGVTYPTMGLDANLPTAFSFLDATYQWYSGSTLPTCYLPTGGVIPSALTPGLTYQMQSYSANNALSVASNTYAGSIHPTTGTLTLTTPTNFAKLFVLYETVLNTAGPSITATITFTDATTQVISGNTVVNWFTATNVAYTPSISRAGHTAPGAPGGCGTGPYLFEMPLTISAGNIGKLVQSITFNWSAATGSAQNTVDYFHALAVSGSTPLTGNTYTTPVISNTTTYYVQASQGGCVSPRVPVVATVTAAPAITVSAPSTLCQGNSSTLSVTSPNDPNYHYTWNPGNLSGSSVSVTPSFGTTYTVSALDTTAGANGGCAISATTNIVVNQRPTITATTASPSLICGAGDSTQLSVTAIPFIPPSGNYTVTSIPFAPVPGVMPNAGPPAGDETNANATLGFNFNYFGNTYTDVTIHSNGQIIMGAGNTTANSIYTPPAIPSTAAPNNWVGVWADLMLNGSDVTWGVVGVAPFRKLVVNFTNVNYFSATPFITFQTVLNETYNTIDVHVTSTNGTVGLTRTIGVENSTGTLGTTAPGRTPGLWSASNESWEFAPPVVSSLNYSWAPPVTINNPAISNPKAGVTSSTTFTVTVTETGTGCTKTATTAVAVSAVPLPYIYPNDTVLCSGDFIIITARDSGAYAGGWPAGTQFDFGFGPTPDSTFFVNGPGVFNVQVYLPPAFASCTGVSPTADIEFRDSPVLIPATSDVLCYGANTGYISSQVFLGSPPYRYKYYNSLGNLLRDTVLNITEDTLFNLPAGQYYIVVNDTINTTYPPPSCHTDSVLVEIFQPAQLIANETHTVIACNGGSSTVTIDATGGTPPYAGTGSFTQFAGTTTYTVTDTNGCVSQVVVTITEPGVLTVGTVVTNIPCTYTGVNIASQVTGGTTPYEYDWSNGATTASLSNKPAGTFTVTVTDAHGCSATSSVTETPPGPVTVAGTSTNLLCRGVATGTITVSVSGGEPVYTYLWNGGSTTQNRTGLASGTYTVTVRDANNCTKTKTFSITQPATNLIINTTQTNIRCFGLSAGVAGAAPSGGTTPYTYSWNTIPVKTTASISSLTAGAYTCTVTDAIGCVKNVIITITEPTDLSVFQTQTNVTFPGGNNGTATVSVSGGTPGYTYSWNTVPVKTTASVTGLTAGTYKCTVTDTKSCNKKVTFIITEPIARPGGAGNTPDQWNVNARPNPSSGQVIISFENQQVEQLQMRVMDFTGRVIFKTEREITGGLNELMYDFSSFGKGVYFVNLEAGDKSKVIRIVIQ